MPRPQQGRPRPRQGEDPDENIRDGLGRTRAAEGASTRAAGDDDGAEASTSEKQEEKFDLELAFANLAARYDWLSAGPGCAHGDSYGVVRGQPVSQALGITVCATVALSPSMRCSAS